MSTVSGHDFVERGGGGVRGGPESVDDLGGLFVHLVVVLGEELFFLLGVGPLDGGAGVAGVGVGGVPLVLLETVRPDGGAGRVIQPLVSEFVGGGEGGGLGERGFQGPEGRLHQEALGGLGGGAGWREDSEGLGAGGVSGDRTEGLPGGQVVPGFVVVEFGQEEVRGVLVGGGGGGFLVDGGLLVGVLGVWGGGFGDLEGDGGDFIYLTLLGVSHHGHQGHGELTQGTDHTPRDGIMVEVFTVRVGVMFLAVPPFELSVEVRVHMGRGFVVEDHIDGDEEVEELGPVATIVKFVGPVEGLIGGVVEDGPDEGRLDPVLGVQVAGEGGGHGLCVGVLGGRVLYSSWEDRWENQFFMGPGGGASSEGSTKN